MTEACSWDMENVNMVDNDKLPECIEVSKFQRVLKSGREHEKIGGGH